MRDAIEDAAQEGFKMRNRLNLILIGVGVATVGVSLASTPVAQAAWPHPAPHGQFDAVGNCDGFNSTVTGTWGFTGLLNSDLLGGDTYQLRFTAGTAGAGYSPWTRWFGPYAVPQSPSTTWIPLRPFDIQRGAWISVYMQLHSGRRGTVGGDWLKQQRVGGDLSEVSADELSCRTLG